MLINKLSNRKIIVDILAVMFGIGAWIGVNGIYVQLPLFVNTAPEGWNLPAHMIMLVQFANLGPIIYTLYSKYAIKNGIQDRMIIYTLLGSATLAIYLLAFLYTKTSTIFGQEHSTALLSLMFVTSIVGCTSSILFMPYMRNYREIYLVSYLVGEGLSGFIPSLVALTQGVGGNPECVNITKPNALAWEFETRYPEPRFSTTVFFIFLGSLLLATFLSFVCLNNLTVAKSERVKPIEGSESLRTDLNAPPNYKTRSGWIMSKQTYYYLLVMMAFVCSLSNGTLPSIQSYSCLPYGNLAYHLTITLASMAQPTAMCLGFFITKIKVSLLTNLTVIALILSGFVYYLALQSPNPPYQKSVLGVIMVVVSWVFLCGLMGFIRMGITTLFRLDPGKGLYHTGIATQVGSMIGAVVTFILVNYTRMFEVYKPCIALTMRDR